MEAWQIPWSQVLSARPIILERPLTLSPELVEECRSELERQLAHLERSMAVTEEAVRPVELDQQAVGRLSRMDSLQNQKMTQNLQEREQAKYAAICAALERIHEGKYGRCVECGEELEAGRLLVFPEAGHCPRCAG